MNPIRLFLRKIFCPIKKSAHGEQSALAVGHDRDGLIIILQMAQQGIELCRSLIKGWHIAIERVFEAAKHEIVVSIEPRIIEQDFRLTPGVEVTAGESVHEDNHILGLKNIMSQMQQAAFVVGLFAKPSFVHQPKPAQCHLIRDERAERQLVIIPDKPSPDQPGDGPVCDQPDEYEHEVAISPAKPPIRSDPVAFLAAV